MKKILKKLMFLSLSVFMITSCKSNTEQISNVKLYYNDLEPISDTLIEKEKINFSKDNISVLNKFIEDFENIKDRTLVKDISNASEYQTSKELLSFNYKDTRYTIYQMVQSDMSDKQVWFLKTNNNGNEKLYRMSIEDELTNTLGKLKERLIETVK